MNQDTHQDARYGGRIIATQARGGHHVHLDDGRDISALIPEWLARLLVFVCAGQRVEVMFRRAPKLPHIVWLDATAPGA